MSTFPKRELPGRYLTSQGERDHEDLLILLILIQTTSQLESHCYRAC